MYKQLSVARLLYENPNLNTAEINHFILQKLFEKNDIKNGWPIVSVARFGKIILAIEQIIVLVHGLILNKSYCHLVTMLMVFKHVASSVTR